MADVLTMLQQFLCYGNQACTQEFQQYAYKPMEGIFYAVFFPIVFILLFVYIVSGAVGTLRARGFRIIIAVAVFAFIILQGWYHFFLMLGRLWLYVIIFLGFIWVLIHTFTGRGGDNGGGGAKGRTGDSGIFSALTKAAKDEVLGVVKVQLQTLEADIATLRNTPKGSHGINDISARINGMLLEMQGNPQKYGLHMGKVNEMRKAYMEICREKGIKIDK